MSPESDKRLAHAIHVRGPVSALRGLLRKRGTPFFTLPWKIFSSVGLAHPVDCIDVALGVVIVESGLRSTPFTAPTISEAKRMLSAGSL